MKKLKFEELKISKTLQKAIAEMGFEETSPVQSEAIPYLLEGRDVIAQAQTGTGKTAAFAIPIIEKINKTKNELQAVVLCPTRELVIQVTEEFRKLMKYNDGINVVAVYGGQEIDRQLKLLRFNPQIIVGTPGRTMDHMRRGSIKMNSVKTVVLDEADEMLDMGFRDDMEIILKDTPKDRQTIMLSATMPDEILKLMKRYQNNPARVDVTHQKINAPKIDQFYFELQEKSKPEALARLIDYYNIKLTLVFCNTKAHVDYLVDILKTRGYFAEGLHGDMNQRQRDKVMNGFRRGSVEILVATDVAGRGIDVSNVEAVFNYDLPRDDEDYVHRIGRTGRAGKSGKSFTFIVGREIYNLKRIERTNQMRVLRQSIPSLEDLDETRLKEYSTQIKKHITEGSLTKYVSLVEKLMGDDYTSLDVAAVLLKISIESKNEGFDEKHTFEKQERFAEKNQYDKPRFQNRNKTNFNKPAFGQNRRNRTTRSSSTNSGTTGRKY